MNLPIYHQINFRHYALEELQGLLTPDLNVKHPVVMNLKALEHDQQREYIGVIENFYDTQGVSFHFPYAVYIVADHEASITNMQLVSKVEELPRFFSQKDAKVTIKENHVLGKNKLLQLELRNTDSTTTLTKVKSYGSDHKQIHELENERLFYANILNRLSKAKK